MSGAPAKPKKKREPLKRHGARRYESWIKRAQKSKEYQDRTAMRQAEMALWEEHEIAKRAVSCLRYERLACWHGECMRDSCKVCTFVKDLRESGWIPKEKTKEQSEDPIP